MTEKSNTRHAKVARFTREIRQMVPADAQPAVETLGAVLFLLKYGCAGTNHYHLDYRGLSESATRMPRRSAIAEKDSGACRGQTPRTRTPERQATRFDMTGVITSGDHDPLRGVSRRIDDMRRLTGYRQSESIYAAWDSVEHWYCVISGAAANYVVWADGRRRIVDILLPGDYFGLSPWQYHQFGAEALTGGTTIGRYPRRTLEAMADDEPPLAHKVRTITLECVKRYQARLLTLGHVTSLGKVASFLAEMARRSSNHSSETIELPMSRYDIADYLAVSVETVSRAFGDLKRRGVIQLCGVRRIRILDATLLNEGFNRPASAKVSAARSASRCPSPVRNIEAQASYHDRA